MTDPKLWYLKQIDLFKGLDSKELEYIGSCFKHKPYKKGDEITTLSEAERIFLLKDGIIELYSISEDGQKIIIDILGQGSVFGSMPESDNFLIEARVRKDCMLCSMPSSEFFKLIAKYPSVSEALLRALYRWNARQQERISSLASETVVQRLKRLLRMLSADVFHQQQIHFTHEELAQMIGTSRQTVTSLINCLKKESKLTKKGKQYYLSADK